MDPADHPATNLPQATEHYAGDVVSFPTNKATVTPNLIGAVNSLSMRRGADTTNVTKLPKK